MTTTVGFLGLGHLGGGMCDHVLRHGLAVAVYDPVEEVVAPRVAAGARRAASPADAAEGADVVCVVVRDDAQARASIAGRGGVLEGIGDDGIVLLHATVAPATVRDLGAACAARGVRFVDAAIAAGAGRETGEMFAMCGGDQATIDAARPVLSCFAKHIVRFGDLGAGMAAKLSRNLVQYSMWAVMAEGLALARAAGLDMAAVVHLWETSGIQSGQEGVLARALLTEPPGPEAAAGLTKSVTLAWKDLEDAFALAQEVGRPTPFGHLTHDGLGAVMGLPDLVPPPAAH
jgi:3-hydroxyisobutyrate dehydrogenase-like beta-hydroxyacid dehydrogenase